MSEAKQSQPDFSMLSRRWNGVTLISGEIAVDIARLVHKSAEGLESLDANEPLAVLEDNDSWIVSGAESEKFDKTVPGLVGPLRIRISKFDAQILSYVMTMSSTKLSTSATEEHNT
jgi:hypothetical protein